MQAFRVADDSSTTPLSDTSVVSMLISVTDANDNSPMFLNPSSSPISVLEVSMLSMIVRVVVIVVSNLSQPPQDIAEIYAHMHLHD